MEKKKNFSEEERAVLLELLSRHRSVVENKRTDAASVSRKRQAWEKIEDEFNCRPNVTPRKWIQLKKCWENLKDKWRRTNAEDMRERFATGGGTPPPSQMTDELQRVGDIASHMAVRLPNPCDSDRSRHNVVPGGSQPSKSQCTPAVAALLSETQDRPLEQFAGCQDMYDESTDLWSWDDNSSTMEDASTNTARPHGQVQDTSDSQPRNGGGAKPSEAAAVPSAASYSAAAAACLRHINKVPGNNLKGSGAVESQRDEELEQWRNRVTAFVVLWAQRQHFQQPHHHSLGKAVPAQEFRVVIGLYWILPIPENGA
ncbi:myb/SANT-like DNA-binding domain-containing protein 3 [Dermacentor silvarum]|uniref:myb/SANT-like DNA-binding domain-containing protein 3 n=1 Tax=Dermacentor silvarum TaxID=543639 RepID=UPI00189776BC|nr:myb/SANT-like DNA-binding domain-containing protein 3 [Dermacentor silvarum]